MKNGKIFKELIINEKTDFCRQYQYLQLEKPSGVEVEIPVHKTLAMDLLKGGPTGPTLGLTGLTFPHAENFPHTENFLQQKSRRKYI